MLTTRRRLLLLAAGLLAPPDRLLAARAARDVRERFFERNASESVPDDQPYVRFIRMRSDLLSAFHGRPVYLRAGVGLPRSFERGGAARYPLWVRIGGLGTRCTFIRDLVNGHHGIPEGLPPMLIVCPDGLGPFGDPSQVNSANNGPYGDAITRELIPYVERRFHGIGEGYARFASGTSTGGWASLALQVFYPDFFNGAYAFWPDPVDFRAFETINVYDDENAYRDRYGRQRAAKRNHDGDTSRTIRDECRGEANEGSGGRWTLSGRQWGAWNAIYSPRGEDGFPAPLWDGETGRIDHAVAAQWKKYDLRLTLEQNWKTLGPKLRGKINIWVGERDFYFLNEAVHLLQRFLSHADPAPQARIYFDPGGGHGGFHTIGTQEMMREMEARVKSDG